MPWRDPQQMPWTRAILVLAPSHEIWDFLQHRWGFVAVRSQIVVSLTWVDWMLSIHLVPEMNRRSLASFTPGAPHPSLYTSTTKLSNRCIRKDWRLNTLGLHIRAPNVTVRSGKLVQTAQAIFLSYRSKKLGSGVALWTRVNVRDIDGRIFEWSEWTGMSRFLFPLSKPTHSSDCQDNNVAVHRTNI